MAKINPFLEKKLFGLAVNEYLGICCGAIFGTYAESLLSSNVSHLIRFITFCVAWIIGIVVYTVIIALIKTYITKED